MKSQNLMQGALCIVVGAVPPYVTYAISNEGSIWNVGLFVVVLVAAIASFVAFAVCRLVVDTKLMRFLMGTATSYLVIFAMFFVSSAVAGDISDSMMWMPVVVMFGVLYMAPTVVMSWLASMLVFSDKKVTKQGVDPNI